MDFSCIRLYVRFDLTKTISKILIKKIDESKYKKTLEIYKNNLNHKNE